MLTRSGFRLMLLVFLLATFPAFAAQTVPLAAGQTAATSSDVTNVTTGTLTIFAPNGYVPASVVMRVYRVANGAETQVGTLSASQPTYRMLDPSVFREKRDDITAQGVNVGVTSDLVAASSTTATVAPTGQTNMAGGLSVAIASDQSAFPVTATLAGTLPAFAATPTFERTSIAPSASSAAEACHVIKASAGTLYAVSGLAGQAEYVMLFNATSAPGDGAVTPVWWGQALTNGAWSTAFQNPLTMSTGITVCYSSTGPLTKTAISTANVFSWEAL